jgi:hypothetical protein
VTYFSWDHASKAFCHSGEVADVGGRLFVVVPAADGSTTGYLVACSEGVNGRLAVTSLPDHEFVGSYDLGEGSKIKGLAADPSGTAIVVLDGRQSDAVHVRVLPWPLYPLVKLR